MSILFLLGAIITAAAVLAQLLYFFIGPRESMKLAAISNQFDEFYRLYKNDILFHLPLNLSFVVGFVLVWFALAQQDISRPWFLVFAAILILRSIHLFAQFKSTKQNGGTADIIKRSFDKIRIKHEKMRKPDTDGV